MCLENEKMKPRNQTIKVNSAQTGTLKTSISLSTTVKLWADQACIQDGYENFSAYIAQLIRQDRTARRAASRADAEPANDKPVN